MNNKVIQEIQPIGFSWETSDPFLFCVHHLDHYPRGNDSLGPDVSLRGRNLGQDFTLKDGWRMYHGEKVPGFPEHPHRGFETVTVVLKGFVDHSDSHGAAGRYGGGDVQWMTAGSGLQHSEMFPLLNRDSDNTIDLFQIWLNLPAEKKMCDPHYKMLWAEEIPTVSLEDEKGNRIAVTTIAGAVQQAKPPEPAPDSWALEEANEVCIWLIHLSPNARYTLPAASKGINRSLYFYKGNKIGIAGVELAGNHRAALVADQPTTLENSDKDAFLLMLQGKPIGEPVARYGPFVMNTESEIQNAIRDFQKTRFGGWPWPERDHTHPREVGRFARYSNGQEEIK